MRLERRAQVAVRVGREAVKRWYQAHPCRSAGTERGENMPVDWLSDHHEESQGVESGRLARKTRVPFWHRGHRVISMPVS